jgi:outer membrane protein assembly factor BamB
MKKTLIVVVAAVCTPPLAAQKNGSDGNWPSFRGPSAAGKAAQQNLPETWDPAAGTNIKWKTPIPGLAHSSPVVWGNQVFVTTAVSSRTDASFKKGLYGDGTASEDISVHQWKVYALDKRSGKVLWERVAYEGVPKEKRHIKSTYASSTPATDGRYVVALFGSQGIYAFDLKGNPKWKADLGRINAGAYNDASYEWGTASSPIIYKDLVIVQCDQQTGSFITALDIKTGKTIWRTVRDELPSWATPAVYPGDGGKASRAELISNSPKFIRGYDPMTGKELWRLGRSSNITAPTPIFEKDLIVVMSGRRPNAPIFVLRPGAQGDITLPEGAASGGPVVWTRERAGSYMPTPLIYDGLLYVLKNDGIFICYDLRTGEKKYEERVPHLGSGFSGSPVAADGKIYLPSEDGDIFIVKAGPNYEVIGKNSMGESLMSTPALSDGLMLVRTEHTLFAIGR